jgi:peptide chain release factor 3
VVQVLDLGSTRVKVPLLAAVGPLQFDVVKFRLESEYGAESRLEPAPWTVARWFRMKDAPEGWELDLPLDGAVVATDRDGQPLLLLSDEWVLGNVVRRNPGLELNPIPFDAEVEAERGAA